VSALYNSQDWHTILDEESITQPQQLKDNDKLVRWDMFLNVFTGLFMAV